MNPSNVIPHSIDAEESVIGALMLDDSCHFTVFDLVSFEHFYDRDLAGIFKVIQELSRAGKPVDMVTVSDEINRRNESNSDDMFKYLGSIMRNTPSAANVKAYCEVMRDRYKGRQIRAACQIGLDSISTCTDYDQIKREIYDNLEMIGASRGEQKIADGQDLGDSLTDDLERVLKQKGGLPYWSTGNKHIDEVTGGLQPGDYFGLAAKSGGGKTTLALNVLRHFMMQDRRCLVFSMEMKRHKVMKKLTSDIGNVEYKKLKTADLNDYEWAKVGDAIKVVKKAKIHVDDSSGLTVDDVCRRARQIKAKYGSLELIVVDYLQRLKVDSNNFYSELTTASNRLKDLFMELGCAGIVLAQLKKNSKGLPNATDLRETGAIENDSDLLCFIHTDTPNFKPQTGMMTALLIDKAREGESCIKLLHNELDYQRFNAVDGEYQEPDEEIF